MMATSIATCCRHRLFSTTSRLSKIIPSKVKGGKSSHDWLTRQLNDPYVKLAQENNLRCRSAFKLTEIDDRFKVLKPGDLVIDCGAAPGSWSQVAIQRVGLNTMKGTNHRQNGTVVAIDIQPIAPIDGVTILEQSDFTKPETQSQILQALGNRLADVVLSDMAPRASGNRELDHQVIFELCISVLKFSSQVLDCGGHVVCKLWDGRNTKDAVDVMKRMFNIVKTVKPEASRSDSAEIFLLGLDYKLRKR